MNIFIFTLSITGKNWRQFISQIVKHLISKTGNLNWVDLPRDIDRNSFGNNMENLCGTMTRPPKERKKESEVAQSCLPLCDPMDRSLPGSSVHGIFQARTREWGAISFSRGDLLRGHVRMKPPCLMYEISGNTFTKEILYYCDTISLCNWRLNLEEKNSLIGLSEVGRERNEGLFLS